MYMLLIGAIPAQVAMASAVASLSSPPAMGIIMVKWCMHNTVKPVTNAHPLGPEKPVFSGRWSLVAGGL